MTCSVFKNMRGGPRGSPNRREGGPVQRAAWTASVECEGQSFQRHLITGRAAGAQGSGWGLCPTKSRTRWPSIQRWSPRKRQIPRTLTVTSFTHQMLPRCVTAAPRHLSLQPLPLSVLQPLWSAGSRGSSSSCPPQGLCTCFFPFACRALLGLS